MKYRYTGSMIVELSADEDISIQRNKKIYRRLKEVRSQYKGEMEMLKKRRAEGHARSSMQKVFARESTIKLLTRGLIVRLALSRSEIRQAINNCLSSTGTILR